MSGRDLVELDDKNWEEVVEKGGHMAVMFYNPTCPHCKAMMPHFEKAAKEFLGRVTFGRINVRDNTYAVNRYGIVAVPTFVFFCGGRPVQQIVGEIDPSVLKKIIEDTVQFGDRCVSKSTPVNFTTGYV
jgi:thioredoxin 1